MTAAAAFPAGDDPRLSDEATGLPPLDQVDDEVAVLTLAWQASAGIVASPVTGQTVAVRLLHVRGLAVNPDDPRQVEWVQVHVAVPVEHAVDVAAALAKGTTAALDDDK